MDQLHEFFFLLFCNLFDFFIAFKLDSDPHSKRSWIWIRIEKTAGSGSAKITGNVDTSPECRVVDPDQHGSGTFAWIRIRCYCSAKYERADK